MRLSSIFVFVTSALLASTSPIDDYSRGNNYLSKRGQPRTETRRDAYDTVIEDKILSNGELLESIVTFGNEVRPPGVSGPITFHFTTSTEEWLEERPNTVNLYNIPLHGRPPLNARDYRIAGSGLVMTYIKNPGHGWMAFYRGRSRGSGYTITYHDLSRDLNTRHFYKGSQQVLLYVNAHVSNAHAWAFARLAMLNNLAAIEWHDPPQQH